MAKIARRNHYIPQHIQKRFVDADGGFWVIDKRLPRLFYARPANSFVETHLYSTTDSTGAKQDGVERALSVMEGVVEPLVEHIVSCVQLGNFPALRPEERDWLLGFFEMQYRRSPQNLAQVAAEEDLFKFFEELIDEYAIEHGAVTAKQRAEYLAPDRVKRLAQNMLMQTMMKLGGESTDALRRRGVVFAKVIAPDKQLILGGRPFSRFRSPDGAK